MKKIIAFLVFAVSAVKVHGQDITGQWNGILKILGIELRVVVNIVKSDKGYTSTMDSPDQQAKGIAIARTTFENSKLVLEITNPKVEYTGELKREIIEGVYKQGGQKIPLNLSRKEIVAKPLIRPQEPTMPYPYYTEEISFQNRNAGITFAGTLSLPHKEGQYPAVILITGSGPQNRDEELMGHKPFLVIADYLTKNGIAVLRYDDRGFGKSTGNFKSATSADFATDVESAIAYLKSRSDIKSDKIGLVGHSEGGLIAPLVAAGSKEVSFIVLLADTGIRGDKLLLLQQELIARAMEGRDSEIEQTKLLMSKAYEIILQSTDPEKLKQDLTTYAKEVYKGLPEKDRPGGMSEDEFATSQVNELVAPWMQYFIKFDPALTLEKVKCPVLAINGAKDLQVPPKENLNAIKRALLKGGNNAVAIQELPNLNHLFQECKTGSPTEYAGIEQTFSPVALDIITKWILIQVSK